MDCQKQGTDFLRETGTEFEVKFLRYDKHFHDDKDNRDIYYITLKRGGREYTFKYGQSINASGRWWKYGHPKKGVLHAPKKPYPAHEWDKNKAFAEPTPYDVLSCLQKTEVGTFENFCGEFGYAEDSRSAERIYSTVVEEYNNLKMLFSDAELEKMQEIE